jgi:ribonuclease HI
VQKPGAREHRYDLCGSGWPRFSVSCPELKISVGKTRTNVPQVWFAAPLKEAESLTTHDRVATGVILVARTPSGVYAWATGSDESPTTITGIAETESAAYRSALEAYLEHPDHEGCSLALEIEQSRASRTVVEIASKVMPTLTVAVRSDWEAGNRLAYERTRCSLASVVLPASRDALPRPYVRITAATASSHRAGHRLRGWSWVNSSGQWESGTVRYRGLAAEVTAIIHMLDAHRDANSILIGCCSIDAIALIQQVRSCVLDADEVREMLRMHPTAVQRVIDGVRKHPADISFRWIRSHRDQALNEAADRLAAQARRAAHFELDSEIIFSVQKSIIDDLRSQIHVVN